MLSRTAESLYWLARYTERAENMARLLQVTLRMAGLFPGATARTDEWHSTLVAAGCADGFYRKYPEARADHVIHYMTRDPGNPSAILSCIETARRNSRAVRTALTTDMWQAVNGTWLEARALPDDSFDTESVHRFLDWVIERSRLFDGAVVGTMLRNDACWFTRLGTFVERADMTARILDVKYHILLPDTAMVGSPLDYYQWAALLKSLSGFEAYRRKYHTGMRPIDVAQHTIFEPDFPRSLEFAVDRIQRALEMIGAPAAESRSRAAVGRLLAHLEHHSAESVMRAGLHEFLQGFLQCAGALNAALQADYFAAHFGAEPCAM